MAHLKQRAPPHAVRKDDPVCGIGSGLSTADLQLRLRYEFRLELAAYIGVIRVKKFSDSWDLAKLAGEDDSQIQFAAGVHFKL